MTEPTTYLFDPTLTNNPPIGIVRILRPLTDGEAELWEVGPMFRAEYVGDRCRPARQVDVFLDELTPLGDDPEPAWGDWWDAEDHESPGGSQYFIETGKRQTRRESFEHSMAGSRMLTRQEVVDGMGFPPVYPVIYPVIEPAFLFSSAVLDRIAAGLARFNKQAGK